MDTLLNLADEQNALGLLKQMAAFSGMLERKDDASPNDRPSTSAALVGDPSKPGVWQPDVRYRSLVEKLPVVTFMASLDERVQELYINPQIEALLGFTQEEWLDNPILWFRQLHPDDREAWVAEFAQTCSTGARFRSEYRLLTRDGRIVWVQGECQIIRDEDGRPMFLQGVAFDITHLKRAALDQEAKLAAEAASRAKSEFLAHMSHEIRTPLNGVVGMIDLLRSTELSDTQKRYTHLAREAADALLRVINDILDFSKIEAGKVEIESLEFDLHKVVEDLTELLAPMAAKKNLALACVLRPEVPRMVVGDPNRLRQVLTNLVNNALKFTTQGHVAMRVSLDRQDGTDLMVRVKVEDTGIGIPADRLDRLFKSFSQVDASTTRKFGGTGLGLAISKRLVELMGGEVGIESEVGKGTTFWFTVKLQAAAGDGAMSPAEELRNVRVLAIESDPSYRRILTDQLDGLLSPASAVVGVEEALETLHQAAVEGNSFAVALVPYARAEASPLFKAIQADPSLKQTNLIAVTDIDDPADTVTVRQLGFFSRLHRPLTQSRVLDAIASATVHPVSSGASNPESPDTAQEAIKGLHFLVAEDNEMNQFVTRETLKRAGCTCEVVGDGALAVQASERGQYDAILMDCQMPGMDGLEASTRIRQREAGKPGSRRIPIIALTAEAIDGDREKCLASGMDGYVTKPINAPDLFAAIRELVPRGGASVPAPAVFVPAPPAPAAPALPALEAPIDVEALLARCMQDIDFANTTLEKFGHRALNDVEQMRSGLASGDAEKLQRLAHNLKSVAGHVNAGTLRKIAYEIEQAGARRDLAFIESQLKALGDETRRCLAFIPQATEHLSKKRTQASPPPNHEVNYASTGRR